MDNTIIIVLAIILLILIVINNVTIVHPPNGPPAKCSQTVFGCCPDGVNSKINFYGTNCPAYNPGPGYLPPPPQPVPPKPHPVYPYPQPQPQPHEKIIGGCAGTRYGCCPDNYTPKIDTQGSNCPK